MNGWLLTRCWTSSGGCSRKARPVFRFHLQQILNFRRQHEETKEFELAQAQRVFKQEEERLAFFRNRRDQCQQALIDRQKAGVSPGEISIYHAYAEHMKEKIQGQIEVLETARKQVDDKKEEVLAARKDRKILDRLREKKHQAFLADSMRQERKQLDEVAVGRFQERARERRR